MISVATIVVEVGRWSKSVIGHAYSDNGPPPGVGDRSHVSGIVESRQQTADRTRRTAGRQTASTIRASASGTLAAR